MATVTEAITELIIGAKWRSKVICAGAELGVFDHIERTLPRTAQAIAAEMNVDPDLLYRLLRALASVDFLNETERNEFTLTEHGHWLRTDTPGSLRYLALLEGGEEHSAIWNHVPAMVRDGRQNAFMRHFGRMAFDHARATP